MDEHFHKLILKNNSSLKKKETIQSMKNTKNHKNSMDKQHSSQKKSSINNFQNLPKSEKNQFYFQSYIKQYRISNLDISHSGIKRFPKTPKNFLFKKGKKISILVKRARTIQTSKNANSVNESFEKSDIFIGGKLDMDLININISILSSYFKATYQDQLSVKRFNEKFKGVEGYEEILLLIHEFKDFNIFDYLNVQSGNLLLLSKEQREERQKNIAKMFNLVIYYFFLKNKGRKDRKI